MGISISVYYVDIQFVRLNWLKMFKGTLLYDPNLLLIVVSLICVSAFFLRSVTVDGFSLLINFILFTVRLFYENSIGEYASTGMTSAAEEMIHKGASSDHALTSFLGVSTVIVFFF